LVKFIFKACDVEQEGAEQAEDDKPEIKATENKPSAHNQ
jgi:hypothetical protein